MEERKTCELPIDLTREEFAEYQTLMSRVNGAMRLRPVQTVGMLAMALLMLGVAGYVFVAEHAIDWLSIGMAAVVLTIAGVTFFGIPARLRRHATQTYDETVAAGHEYYGMLRVYDQHIEKVSRLLTATVEYNRGAFFIEHPTMMIFGAADRPAIVLPARCMTPEAANAVRAAADRLPVGNRKYFGRLQPQSCPAVPQELPQPTVLWEQTMRYTPEEFLGGAQDMLRRHFGRMLPLFTVASVFAGLIFAWPESVADLWRCVVWFLASLGLLTLFYYVLPRRRAAHAADVLTAEQMTLTVQITTVGLCIRNVKNEQIVPWDAVSHVYDRGTYAEALYRGAALRIPKRCIPDIDEFNRILRECREQKV